MRILLAILILFGCLEVGAKSIAYYRCQAEDGTTVLADRPCGEDAENLELDIAVPEPVAETPETPAAPAVPGPQAAEAPPAEGDVPQEPVKRYSNISVLSPKNGEVIRSDDGSVAIALSTTPALQEDDTIRIVLDGKQVAEAQSTRIMITGVDKGRRTLLASIYDKKGNLQAQSMVIRFIRF